MDLTIIRNRLDTAREQYHKLMTGKAARVLVDQNGERIEYTSVSSSSLLRYIRDLEAIIDRETRGRNSSGPLRFIW